MASSTSREICPLFQVSGRVCVGNYYFFLSRWVDAPVKPSGPGVLSVGRLSTINSIFFNGYTVIKIYVSA